MAKKKQKVFFVGRFQPFHKGHFQAIKNLGKKYGKIKIGIGSSQESNTSRNPYSASIRKKMIEETLKENHVNFEYEIYEIPDIPDDDKWISHVKEITGDFDIAYTNNNWPYKLFKNAGIQAKKQKMIKPKIYNGTYIRNKIARNERWQHLVPIKVKSIIQNDLQT